MPRVDPLVPALLLLPCTNQWVCLHRTALDCGVLAEIEGQVCEVFHELYSAPCYQVQSNTPQTSPQQLRNHRPNIWFQSTPSGGRARRDETRTRSFETREAFFRMWSAGREMIG